MKRHGTITRFLQLDLSQLSEAQLQGAVTGLCERLFQRGKDGQQSTYENLVEFASQVFQGGDNEESVANRISSILLDLYPKGKLRAQNSAQLEGLLRTAVRNALVDNHRKKRRTVSLDHDPIDSDGSPDAEADTDASEIFGEFRNHLVQLAEQEIVDSSLVPLLDRLYQSKGAVEQTQRSEIAEQLGISVATYYRRKNDLLSEFLAFLDS